MKFNIIGRKGQLLGVKEAKDADAAMQLAIKDKDMGIEAHHAEEKPEQQKEIKEPKG